MELALYCPDCGFYEKEGDNVGRRGDFFTSVSVGPLFGELLAFQFSRWFENSGRTRLHIIEAGAHTGRLARDVVDWFQARQPAMLAGLKYTLLEPSQRRRGWQRKTLADFGDHLEWASDWSELRQPFRDKTFTLIYSNELLDALPVRRFGWDLDRQAWFEWGVTVADERFAWTKLPAGSRGEPDQGTLDALPSEPELLRVLPDGFTAELNQKAEAWWHDAARSLYNGKLLTFDYGLDLAVPIRAEQPQGTLRAYRSHKVVDDVLADPGEQDITANVDFTRIESAGLRAGLITECFATQGSFLTRIAAEAWGAEGGFGSWDAKRTRQFQTLTHPEHLGRSFRVLVQTRCCSS